MAKLCPYCETVEMVATSDRGLAQCPSCHRSALPDPKDAATSAGPDHAAAGLPLPETPKRRIRGGPGEVPSLPPALLGLVATLLFYGLLLTMPSTRLSELFLERGWVPYAITGISAWALFILAAKVIRLRKERSLLSRDWLNVPLSERVDQSRAGRIAGQLEQKQTDAFGSFVAQRIERLLRQFEARGRVAEAAEFLTTESQADEGRVEASYGLVRVFVWAVPTLGFIGTVIGIGGAVAGFSETLEAASSIDGMKDSIGSVTGGLGVAFDTTLLALVMSILIMFPSNAVQRLEEIFLTEVDDYCTERIVRRFEETEGKDVDAALINALAERLVLAMGEQARSAKPPKAP
ncbi:MAG: MotA/TolQ/ExbB proton channel family protein [Myxococcota bacterium]